MRRAAVVLCVWLTALCGLTAVALFIAAIWTFGPDSARLSGTGAIVLTLVLLPAYALLQDLDRRSRDERHKKMLEQITRKSPANQKEDSK